MQLEITMSNERRRKVKMKEPEINLWIKNNCKRKHNKKIIKNKIVQQLYDALKHDEGFELKNLLELLEEFLKNENNLDTPKLAEVSSDPYPL